MKGFSLCVTTAGAITLLNGYSSCKYPSKSLPYIILIMVNDMGYETPGFNGGVNLQ